MSLIALDLTLDLQDLFSEVQNFDRNLGEVGISQRLYAIAVPNLGDRVCFQVTTNENCCDEKLVDISGEVAQIAYVLLDQEGSPPPPFFASVHLKLIDCFPCEFQNPFKRLPFRAEVDD